MSNQHITNRETLYSGKFLEMELLQYIDGKGVERKWEAVKRVNSNGVVVMIVTVAETQELVLVRQFRPPLGTFNIEFPAGLIDDGESPQEAAIRELKEETGYIGWARSGIFECVNSSGMSGEKVFILQMRTFSHTKESPKNEESEDIEVILVPIVDLVNFIEVQLKQGNSIDSKIISYSLGIGGM